MMEGLFNLLGSEIISVSTIVPLFFAEYGAPLALIGALPAVQGVLGAIMPLLAGRFVQQAQSKRKVSLWVNGIGRGAVLILPVLLLAGFSPSVTIPMVFGIFILFFMAQSITGISWNYLLGTSVRAEDRGKLLGNLVAYSGMISFGSTYIVRLIRESESLSIASQYATIFGLGGVLMVISVLFFIPLKEAPKTVDSAESKTIVTYLKQLGRCLKNKQFRHLLVTQGFSTAINGIHVFVYVLASGPLQLGRNWVSNMLVMQTLGTVVGGFLAGKISTRFGTKRTILTMESLGLLVPLQIILAIYTGKPVAFMMGVAFVLGLSKSGSMSYQNYLLELTGEQSIYYLVSKSIVLLPLSVVSTLVGWYMERFSLPLLYILQILLGIGTILSALRLHTFRYSQKESSHAIVK